MTISPMTTPASRRPDRLDPATRASRISGHLAAAAVVIALVITGAFLWLAVSPSALEQFLRREILSPDMPATLGPATHVALVAVLVLPLAVALATLWTARQLLSGFARGEVFTIETGQRLRRVGALLLALQICKVAVATLGTLIATIGNPPGSRMLAIGFSSDNFVIALVGGLMIAVGWAMTDAARLAEENRGFV